jgi:hypothetical protein
MPSVADHLRTAQANYAQQLAELSDPAKRKVSYSVGGRSISWTEYQTTLLNLIKDLDKQIATAETAPGDGLGYLATAVP